MKCPARKDITCALLPRRRKMQALCAAAACVSIATAFSPVATAAQAYAPPAILDYFGGPWQTIINRAPDIFGAGYGSLLTPPPTRADSGNASVGYDVYNRFDLGSPNDPTAYGTINGYESLIATIHQMGGYFYTDYSLGHNGFSNAGSVDGNGVSFTQAGGYPGFTLSTPTNAYGDFNNPADTNVQTAQLAGLTNINFNENYQFLRMPTTPGNIDNITGGTQPAFGRIANLPMPANQQFYPQPGYNTYSVTNPDTGQTGIQVNAFNANNPQGGSPTLQNDTGYLMNNVQWFVQTLGVDGFRLDAVKNMEWPTILPYFNQAVQQASGRTYLNGQQEQVYSFGEYYDSNIPQGPGDPIDPGANLNALNFPLFFALQGNLTGDGITNNWNSVISASGLVNNGGVSFVQSQDNGAPYLSNVAYAYTLMMPGQSIVYYNGNGTAFDSGTQSFPQNGREDALGGVYGNLMANNSLATYSAADQSMTVSHYNQVSGLVDIRNRYSTGAVINRYVSQNNYAFERQDSAVVLLNNQTGGGNLSTTIQTDFNPANVPYLVEVTGNAAASGGLLPQVLKVNADGTVNVTFPNNATSAGQFTGQGYLIYGPATPIGTMAITNAAGEIPGTAPAASAANIVAANGANMVTNVAVVKGSQFQIRLQTQPVYLLGQTNLYDANAGGNNAIFQINGGLKINGQSFVSTSPNSVGYGYLEFQNASPLVGGGTGLYTETVNTSDLPQGYNYIEAIAFRARSGVDAPPIYTDWTQSIYVDTKLPQSTIMSFNPVVHGINQNRNLVVQSSAVDGLANNVHVLFDLPAADTAAQIISLIGNTNQATQTDTNQWTIEAQGLTSGNHVATIVSYKPDGTFNIQRIAGLFTSTIYGQGLGDLNFNGQYNAADVQTFASLLASNNTEFNPAADYLGTGVITPQDLIPFGQTLLQNGASASTLSAYDQLLVQYGLSTSNVPGSVSTPEPCSLAILFLGIAALSAVGRRQRNPQRYFHSGYGDKLC